MKHFKIPYEVHASTHEQDLLDRIDERSMKRFGKTALLYTGFDGIKVAKRRSFGSRWHTYALTRDEDRELFELGNSSEPGIVEYAESSKLPAIGVFNPEVLLRIVKNEKLHDRFFEEEGHQVMPNQYGVYGESLDEAALAVYYLSPK